MTMTFAPATRVKRRLKLAIVGPSGSGKTYTALRLARGLAENGKIAVLDTENHSASLYVGESPDGEAWAFDALDMQPPYHPDRFVEAIKAAEEAGYDALIIDSLTHAWSGSGGLLALVDNAAGRGMEKWKIVKPIERRLWDTLVSSKIHIIACLRANQKYEVTRDDRGKVQVEKLGLGAEQRKDLEYEFDVVLDMDHQHAATVSKTRCSALRDQRIREPGQELADTLAAWLDSGISADDLPANREDLAKLRSRLQAKGWLEEFEATHGALDASTTRGLYELAKQFGTDKHNAEEAAKRAAKAATNSGDAAREE